MWTLLVLVYCARVSDAAVVIPLDSYSGNAKWILIDNFENTTLPAVVPGGVYTDLMRGAALDDILLDTNDLLSRWVAKRCWTYTGTFNVTADHLKLSTAARLVLHGLDTQAYVELNEHPLMVADNMFVSYSIAATKYLKVGLNVLNITFESPIIKAKARSKKKFVAPACVPSSYHGECHVNQIRKMQASFGWDWGPAFPSVGIWKPIHLEIIKTAIIRTVTAHFTQFHNSWRVFLNVTLSSGRDNSVKVKGFLTATITVDSKANITVGHSVGAWTQKDGDLAVNLVLNVSKNVVNLWWPNGYGDQPLYPVELKFVNQDSSEESTKIINIGFRTVELVQDMASKYIPGNSSGMGQEGLVFYFKINGYPIFMKGTNWIPSNILPELAANETTIDHLLNSAAHVHMNMLRVWGGGLYESDYFYHRCDQLGILVWQDLMFACSMYPVDYSFIRSVRKEVIQNVVRLQHHTSIALWAGNNENEAALRGHWYAPASEFSTYKKDYVKLYVNTIKPLVESIDPGRTFVVSSPSNGKQSEKEGYVAQNPYDSHYGDTHYYNYVSDGWAMSTYPYTRFASEYGFQAFPSIATLRTASSHWEYDLRWRSDFVTHRQHSPEGNELMKVALDSHLELPEKDPQYFEKFVFYSQITQAMSLKAETEFYRQSRSDWLTMGALYWQLNDVWQAPSWSSIEFGGRWKISHYFARNFFSPILVSPRLLPTGDIHVYVINDKLVPIDNAVVTIDVLKYDNLMTIQTQEQTVNVGPLKVLKTETNISGMDTKHNSSILYRFSLKSSEGKQLSPINYVFLTSLKNITGLKNPNIKIRVVKTASHDDLKNHYKVTITTDTVVLFLWLDTAICGHFSDNGLIISHPETELEFITDEKIEAEELETSIKWQYYSKPAHSSPRYSNKQQS